MIDGRSSNTRDRWNLQDAKARLSELVDLAMAGQPQVILRRGVPAVAIVSLAVLEGSRPAKTLVSFLLNPPLPPGEELDLSHSSEPFVPRTDLFDDEA